MYQLCRGLKFHSVLALTFLGYWSADSEQALDSCSVYHMFTHHSSLLDMKHGEDKIMLLLFLFSHFISFSGIFNLIFNVNTVVVFVCYFNLMASD